MKLPNFQVSREIKIALSALGAVCVIAGSVLLLSVFSPKSDQPIVEPTTSVTELVINRHSLTGEIITEPMTELPQVFGVMVENSADAWPLSGLDQAFLVIEAPVEGGIPRFISFFSTEQTVSKIGPVRSARPYYLDWNDELDAIYAHVGGSPEALDLIKYTYQTIDLNQFWYGDFFYRQNSTRYAPHNVYTNSELLAQAAQELRSEGKLVEAPVYQSWQFKDDQPIAAELAKSLTIDFAPGSVYDVAWNYQPETNDYLRYQSGEVMKMTDGAVITANNVVVLAMDIRVIDSVSRRHIQTVGQGDALISQDGETYLARWKKDSRTDRLRFYTADGYEISLNAGKTWIEVVPSLSQASSQ
jgi:hypothetical protein